MENELCIYNQDGANAMAQVGGLILTGLAVPTVLAAGQVGAEWIGKKTGVETDQMYLNRIKAEETKKAIDAANAAPAKAAA